MNPRLLELVKKGGIGSSRGKYNQRGRPNGGGMMNDFRNRSQQMPNGQRPSSGTFGNGTQRPMSRFSNAQNGSSSYQPRPYNDNTGNMNQPQKSAYVPRSATSNYPQKNGSYFDATTAANGSTNQSRPNSEQSKFNGFQTKSSTGIQNVYTQQAAQQSYQSQAGIPSLYNLPPPSLSFNTAQSASFNYPPPVLPVKN